MIDFDCHGCQQPILKPKTTSDFIEHETDEGKPLMCVCVTVTCEHCGQDHYAFLSDVEFHIP